MDEKNSYALLIGVGRRPEDAEGMSVSEDDAGNMSKAIEKYCRIPAEHTVLLKGNQAGRDNIVTTLKQLAEKTAQQQADTVIIYFSGHGCRISNDLYFVAHDSRNDDIPGTGISGTEWMDLLKYVRANKMLVILDCCHSGALTHSATHKWEPKNVPFDAEAFVAGKNRVVLTASHSSQVSYLSRPVSIFTYAFIEALSGEHLYAGDKNVTIFDVALYVRERVVYLSKEIDISNPQKPGLALLEKSATENFVLARYPKSTGEPYAFTEAFSALTFGKKNIPLGKGTEFDKSYRQTLTQYFNLQINQIQGDNNKSANQQGTGNNLIQAEQVNYYFGSDSKDPSRKNPIVLSEPFTPEECKVLAEQREDYNDGLIHIKHNNAIYLQPPGNDPPFKYFLQGERFSAQIISLLQRISYEDILRDPEFELLGISLFNRLFPTEEVKEAVQKSLLGLSSEKQYGRIRFVFQFDEHSLETAFIPWEYLYFQPSQGQKGFFFGERCAITRRLDNRRSVIDQGWRINELNILFALSPYLLNSNYINQINSLKEGLKDEIRSKVNIDVVFAENLDDLKTKMKWEHNHVIHLVGIAKQSHDSDNPFHFGFLKNQENRFSCSKWETSDGLFPFIRGAKASFVFLHPCKVSQPDLLENRSEQNFIAMTGLAFQMASVVSGALALQTGFETQYTFSFLKNFYNAATSGVELYRAVHESMKNLAQSGLDDDTLPRNRVLGMSALFSDLRGKFVWGNSIAISPINQKYICPNYDEMRKQNCTMEFELNQEGQPPGYRCSSCKKQRMICKNKDCGKLIDQKDINEKLCSHCGKNPLEESRKPEESMKLKGTDRSVESFVTLLPGTSSQRPFIPQPNTPQSNNDGSNSINLKTRRHEDFRTNIP